MANEKFSRIVKLFLTLKKHTYNCNYKNKTST